MHSSHPCATAPPFANNCYYLKDFDFSKLDCDAFSTADTKDKKVPKTVYSSLKKGYQFRVQLPRAIVMSIKDKSIVGDDYEGITSSNQQEFTDERMIAEFAGKQVHIKIQYFPAQGDFDAYQFNSSMEQYACIEKMINDVNACTIRTYRQSLPPNDATSGDTLRSLLFKGRFAYNTAERTSTSISLKLSATLPGGDQTYPPVLSISNLNNASHVFGNVDGIPMLRPGNIIYAQIQDGNIWKKNEPMGQFGHHLYMLQAITDVRSHQMEMIIPDFILQESQRRIQKATSMDRNIREEEEREHVGKNNVCQEFV